MIIVTDLSGNSEVINKFSSFEIVEELNGAFTLSLISYRHEDNPGHDLIMQEGFIEYDGYNFRIKQLRKQSNSIQVSCVSTYYDNVDVYKYDEYGGTRTLGEFVTYVLSGTGWSWTSSNVDIDESKFIPNFGQNNVIKLMDIIKSTFGIEVGIDRNNQIVVSKLLGPDNDDQYRYGYNIVSITESIDTTKLKTYIEGFGANGLHVTYTSPYASTPGIGIRHADPIYDDEYVDADALLEHLKTQLYDHPDSIVELDDAALSDKQIGERVWLIHERMGIEYQTRVVARRVRIPTNLSTVTLGTYLPQTKTISNVLASQQLDIDKNNAISRSRFEQTNEKILLEVSRLDGADSEMRSSLTITADKIATEVLDRQQGDATSISHINQTASEIRADVTTEIERIDGTTSELQSSLTLQADRITAEVTNRQNADTATLSSASSMITQTAGEIRSEVTTQASRLDGRIDSANSLISQQAGEILLRVTKDGVISAINQTAESVRISANKINLEGAVTVTSLDPSLNGKLTKIDGNGVYTGTITADQILAGIITAAIEMRAAKIRTAPTASGEYIELWNAADVQPTIRFYGAGPHVITTGGADLIVTTGSDQYGSIYLRAGSYVRFDGGIVDFSGADGIIWGPNQAVAKFA